jgi:hypothetical protein
MRLLRPKNAVALVVLVLVLGCGGPPSNLNEAMSFAAGTWSGVIVNFRTDYRISQVGDSFRVEECSMIRDMKCGEIGGPHEVSEGRYMDTGGSYFSIQTSWGCQLVLLSSSTAKYSCSDSNESVAFKKID